MKRLAYLVFIVGLIFSPHYLFSQTKDIPLVKTNENNLTEELIVQDIQSVNKLFNEQEYPLASEILLKTEQNLNKIKQPEYLSEIQFQLARLYHQATLFEISLNHGMDALNNYKALNEVPNEIRVHILMASNYSELKKWDSSEMNLKSALTLAQNNGFSDEAAIVFTHLAELQSMNLEYAKAAMYFQSANLILQAGNQHRKLAINHYKIGENLLKQKKTETALNTFMNSFNEAETSNFVEYQAKSAYALANIYLEKKNVNQALNLYQKVINLKDEEGILKSKSLSYQKIAQIQEEKGNITQALKYSKQARIFTIKSESYANQIKLNQLKLRSSLIEFKDKNLNDQISGQLKNSKKNNKSQSILLVGLSIIILALIITFWLKFKKTIKNTSKQITDKNLEINELETSLNDFNNKLESEITVRTKELQEELNKRMEMDLQLKKALKNAEDANYLKNAFLSNMSHEIRTPLNGIIGFSNLLVTELSIMENQELFEFANGIQQSGDRLLHLLNNIIDISRIEANDMEVKLAPCKTNEVIERVADLYKFKANEKKLKFNTKYNEIPDVLVDEQNLTKIISDIIDNAVKYTEKGFINVITDYVAEDGQIVISVKDTGIGIDESYLKHVFEAFRQESLGYSRNYQGAGLGLPLAKRMITLMNGDIKVESTKGVGTTVKIFLKTSDSPAKIIKSKEPEQRIVSVNDREDEEKINIFIVEDDRMNRLVLSKMLDKVGNNSLAVDGDETLSIIERAYENGVIFDVMLFDINLPAPWDGIKLMQEIKSRWKEYKFIPFIAQTAYAMAGDRERLLDSGFDNYIAKPVNKNELISIIFKHIGITNKN